MKIVLWNRGKINKEKGIIEKSDISMEEFEKKVREILKSLKSDIRVDSVMRGSAWMRSDLITVSYHKHFGDQDDAILLDKIKDLLKKNGIPLFSYSSETHSSVSPLTSNLKSLDLKCSSLFWKQATHISTCYVDEKFASKMADEESFRKDVIAYYPMPKLVLNKISICKLNFESRRFCDSSVKALDLRTSQQYRHYFNPKNPYHLLVWAIENNNELRETLSKRQETPLSLFLRSIENKTPLPENEKIRMSLSTDKITVIVHEWEGRPLEGGKWIERSFPMSLPEKEAFQQMAKEEYTKHLKG